MTTPATINLESAARETWDVVVVGAGPAGALAAGELARENVRVLLVERKCFPRMKVCGCCLNGQALSVLRELGLEKTLADHGAVPLHEFRLSAFGRRLALPLPNGRALSRARFDSLLVDHALQSGADFLPETQATIGEAGKNGRTVHLDRGGQSRDVPARVVLAADGLGGNALRHLEEVQPRISKSSRIGAGGIFETSCSFFSEGTIFMAVGQGGYVGLVRLEDGRLNVAAALDKGVVRESGGVGPAVESILQEAEFPALPLAEGADWQGTPSLTQTTVPRAAERLFLIGDSAGYAEPFTGQGIAWALESGRAVVPFTMQAVSHWEADLLGRWENSYRKRIAGRQQFCRQVCEGLRHPLLAGWVAQVLGWFPTLAQPLVSRLNAPASFHRVRGAREN